MTKTIQHITLMNALTTGSKHNAYIVIYVGSLIINLRSCAHISQSRQLLIYSSKSEMGSIYIPVLHVCLYLSHINDLNCLFGASRWW